MANGILMPEVEDPQRAAAQSIMQMQQQPQATGSGYLQAPQQMQQQPQQQYMGPQNLREIYGILAQGNNPGQVGQNYVTAMQAQQRADTANDPMQQFLRLYGNVNPYDYTPESLADFQDTLSQTGDIAQAFRKLVRHDPLSSKEQGFLNDAVQKYQETERNTARMMGLAQRFEQAHAQGIRTGALGRLEEWFLQFAGDENDFTLLRSEYDRLRNSEVIQGLPKGPASDKDIAIAERGFPPATANAQYIATFLRGMAKMRAIEQAQAMHAADFISRTQSQKGMLDDWTRDKDYWIRRAIQQTGGWYAPVKEDGTPMTADEAMAYRYGDTTRVGATPPAEIDTSAAAAAADEVVRNVETVMEKYRRLKRERAMR